MYKAKAKWINIIGILIGLIGAVGLLVNSGNDIVNGDNRYAILVIVAAACYAISVNQIKYMLSNLNGIEITSLAFLIIGPPSGLYLLFSDYSFALSTPDYLENLMYILILAAFSSVLAVVLFNHLIKHTTTVFATSVTYLIPIFAIFWGFIDGETISLTQFAWIGLILLGVYLVNKL